MEDIKRLSTLSVFLEDPSVVGLLRIEEQQVLMAVVTVYWQQYYTKTP